MLNLRKLGPVMSAAAIGAVVTVGGAGIAAANSSTPATRAAVPGTAAAKAPCLALWAVVNKGGKLQRAGCPGTTSSFVGDGYQVLFYRNVRDCAYVADAGNSGSSGIAGPAIVTTAGRRGHVRGVFVAAYSLTGKTIQRGFHLIAEC
jgi:hypothetical protein